MSLSESHLKQDIELDLKSDPSINAQLICVEVRFGVISLVGSVGSYAEKLAVERAAMSASGGRTLDSHLKVMVLAGNNHSDADIATATQHILDWDVFVPSTVRVSVAGGYATLCGKVDWNYQRHAAERAIRNVSGVQGLLNQITVTPRELARRGEYADSAPTAPAWQPEATARREQA